MLTLEGDEGNAKDRRTVGDVLLSWQPYPQLGIGSEVGESDDLSWLVDLACGINRFNRLGLWNPKLYA